MSFNPTTNIERARIAWGEDMPSWVELLAATCDRLGQIAVGERVGRSSGTISRLVNRKYGGNYAEAETLVRATFGAEIVECPVMGEIPLAGCVRNRRRSAPPRNHLHQLWARHCPGCPFNTDNPDEED